MPSSFAVDNPTLVSYLLKLGANPNLGPLIPATVGSMGRHCMNRDSGSILQFAVACGNLESVDLLIAHGAVLSYADSIHVAVDSGNLEMMAHLLELGADIEQLDSLTTMGQDRHGTPLLRAIAKGKTDMVRFLLENWASTTAKGHSGETPMKMVREDWVIDEIRKIVEEVGERGPKRTERERDRGEKEGKMTEMEQGVERREIEGTRDWVGEVGKYDIGYLP